jgi:hypothetical protein
MGAYSCSIQKSFHPEVLERLVSDITAASRCPLDRVGTL